VLLPDILPVAYHPPGTHPRAGAGGPGSPLPPRTGAASMVMLAAGGFPACLLPTEPRPNLGTRATQVRLQTHRPTGNPRLPLVDLLEASDLLQAHATGFLRPTPTHQRLLAHQALA